MTDEKKEKPSRIGGVPRYATLGKPPDIQKSESPDAQQSSSADIQTSSTPINPLSEHADVQTARSSDAETAKSPNVRKSKHPTWKQQTIYLPPDLIVKLKMRAVLDGRELS